MAREIPTTEPRQAIAGDTLQWLLTLSGTPASDSWTPSYRFAGARVLATQAEWIVESGAGWLVTIPPSATADLPPGDYRVFRTVTKEGAQYTEELPLLTLEQNPASMVDGDGESYNARVVRILRAAIEGDVSDGVQMYQLAGRTVSSMPFVERQRLLEVYERRLTQERRGAGVRRQRLITFGPVP